MTNMIKTSFVFLTYQPHIVSQQPSPCGSEEKDMSGTEDDNYYYYCYYYFDQTSLRRLTHTMKRMKRMKRMKMMKITLNSRRVFMNLSEMFQLPVTLFALLIL